MRLFTILAISIVLFSPVALAQGTLSGMISDSANGEAMIGATVILQGTSLGAASDINGNFRIAGIPERLFTIRISYLGYEPEFMEVDFSVTKDQSIDVKLKPTVIQGQEVIVTGQMKGQLAAMNQQLTSKTIINVVSEEKIQELPDANAAEAIGRLPGVSIIRSGGEATNVVMRGLSSKFSTVTVDGVKVPPTGENSRDIDLSMMSQGALAGIELYKTLTPDQDADAIAGSVNLVTKKAPSERLLRFDIKGNYNNLMKSSKQYDLSLRYGERFFNDRFGFQFQGSTEKKIRSKENIAYGYGYSNNADSAYRTKFPIRSGLANIYGNDYNINQFTVDFTDELRTRNGLQTILDYNTSDSGTVKLSGVYSKTGRNIMVHERNYPVTTGGYDYNYQYTELSTSTVNVALQGKNYLKGMTIDWLASYAHSKTENPFGYRMSFQEGSGGASSPPSKDHPEINIIPYMFNNFQNATLDSTQSFRTDVFDKEHTYQLNISKNWTLFDRYANDLKIGGKYKNKTRWKNRNDYAWNNYRSFPYFSNADGSAIDFAGTRFEGATVSPILTRFFDLPVVTRDLMGIYRMTPQVSLDALKEWAELTQHGGFSMSPTDYGSNGVSILGNYFVTERVYSAFLMNTLNVGDAATLIFGVRMEKEENDYNAKYSDLSVGGTGIVTLLTGKVVDTTAKYSETIWLPSAQLSLKPTDYLTLRLAAYRALARPDFNLRLPQFSFNTTAAGTNLVAGNPNLRDTKAWNFEINTQVYSKNIGLFSVSAFYKILDDLYHQTNNVNISWPSGGPNTRIGLNGWTTNARSGIYNRLDNLLNTLDMQSWKNNAVFVDFLHRSNTFNITFGYNSPTPSYAWGIEIEHQFNLGFVPVSWLRNIVLSYNISITRSQTEILINKDVVDTVYIPPAGPRPASYNYYTNNVPVFVKRESEDQPELYANAAIGYDLGGFSARISVYYQDIYTRQYSASGTTDVVVDAFTKWDLALKQEILKRYIFFFNVNNIFNKKESTSRLNNLFEWGYLSRTAELYGTSMDLGVRISL